MQLNAAKEPQLFREKRIKALLYLNLTNGFTICLSFTQAWVLRSCSRALWHVDRKSSGSNHQLRLHNIYRFSIDNTICTCAIVKSQDLRCQAVSTSTSTSVYSVQLGGKGSQLRTQTRGGGVVWLADKSGNHASDWSTESPKGTMGLPVVTSMLTTMYVRVFV